MISKDATYSTTPSNKSSLFEVGKSRATLQVLKADTLNIYEVANHDSIGRTLGVVKVQRERFVRLFLWTWSVFAADSVFVSRIETKLAFSSTLASISD